MKKRKLAPRTKWRGKNKKRRNHSSFLLYLVVCTLLITAGSVSLPDVLRERAEPGTIREIGSQETEAVPSEESDPDNLAPGIPEYTGKPYVEINGNKPDFTEDEEAALSIPGYEYYSALDTLGRCGYCEACVGQETMPEDDRGDIWMVHPSGWRSGQGWERCHLVGFQLTGENANDHNLITGTHSFNVDGMLPFENEVASAAWEGKHVMYRVTPVYKDYELVPRGVRMTAKTVEDDSVEFNVFVFNVEPGKKIDYVTGYVR